jgi:hypothetical protein
MALVQGSSVRVNQLGGLLALAGAAIVAALLLAHPLVGDTPDKGASPGAPLPSVAPDVLPTDPRLITIDEAPTAPNRELIVPTEGSSDPGTPTPASPQVQAPVTSPASDPQLVAPLQDNAAPDRVAPSSGTRIVQRAEERGSPAQAGAINPHLK